MAIQNNFPAIRPTLLLDFANTGRLDPRITFTRASSATFFDQLGVLQTAASGAARFTYDPATLQPQGLLIEEQRTNSFPNSNDFSNATYWTVYGTAVATGSAAVGPDGLTSASNLAGATDTTLSGNNLEESVSISASTAYTFSVFVKSNGGTEVVLRLRDSTGGSTSSVTLAVTSAWQRVSLTRTMAVGATSVRCIIGQTNGNILIYGAQLEAGAFATSYIPTTTTALTRNADVASMTGTNFSSWYNQSEGTVYSEFSSFRPADSANAFAYDINQDGTNYISVRTAAGYSPDRIFPAVLVSGTAQFTGETTVNTGYLSMPIGVVKNTLAYKVNDFASSWNAVTPLTDTSGTLPVPTQMFIGVNGSSSAFLNGTIRKIAFYPQRLSNAQLQALTG